MATLRGSADGGGADENCSSHAGKEAQRSLRQLAVTVAGTVGSALAEGITLKQTLGGKLVGFIVSGERWQEDVTSGDRNEPSRLSIPAQANR